jgi:hypothetical protein
MTSHTGRVYALALALVVFFLAWATIAAHPWGATATDPRLRALSLREKRLRQEAKLVRAVVAQRWATYRARLQVRRTQIAAAKAAARRVALAPSASPTVSAAAPSVRVVNLPPLTITRTS